LSRILLVLLVVLVVVGQAPPDEPVGDCLTCHLRGSGVHVGRRCFECHSPDLLIPPHRVEERRCPQCHVRVHEDCETCHRPKMGVHSERELAERWGLTGLLYPHNETEMRGYRCRDCHRVDIHQKEPPIVPEEPYVPRADTVVAIVIVVVPSLVVGIGILLSPRPRSRRRST